MNHAPTCKDCGKPVYWIAGMGLWYHCGLYDMLTCRAAVVEPAKVEV